MDEKREQCGYVVDPVFGRLCPERIPFQLWHVFYRQGTGWYLVEKPYVRCGQHLGELVGILGRNEYETGYLDHVEPVVARSER